MIKFDENKVISCANAEQAEVGKWYLCSDSISYLKEYVEGAIPGVVITLERIETSDSTKEAVFISDKGVAWQLLYPWEEGMIGLFDTCEELEEESNDNI